MLPVHIRRATDQPAVLLVPFGSYPHRLCSSKVDVGVRLGFCNLFSAEHRRQEAIDSEDFCHPRQSPIEGHVHDGVAVASYRRSAFGLI